jgi:hypothetical protein
MPELPKIGNPGWSRKAEPAQSSKEMPEVENA